LDGIGKKQKLYISSGRRALHELGSAPDTIEGNFKKVRGGFVQGTLEIRNRLVERTGCAS
jgi:hypothetical protein